MTNLPPEQLRCRPAAADSKCQNCKRWIDHPEQLVFTIARVVNTIGSHDKACIYVPASHLEAA